MSVSGRYVRNRSGKSARHVQRYRCRRANKSYFIISITMVSFHIEYLTTFMWMCVCMCSVAGKPDHPVNSPSERTSERMVDLVILYSSPIQKLIPIADEQFGMYIILLLMYVSIGWYSVWILLHLLDHCIDWRWIDPRPIWLTRDWEIGFDSSPAGGRTILWR